jgi:hypothetical protein
MRERDEDGSHAPRQDKGRRRTAPPRRQAKQLAKLQLQFLYTRDAHVTLEQQKRRDDRSSLQISAPRTEGRT